jgi:hypothetical protein
VVQRDVVSDLSTERQPRAIINMKYTKI